MHRAYGLARQAVLAAASHDAKAVVAVINNFPRDELFQASVPELVPTVRGIVNLYERDLVRLFVRRDPFERADFNSNTYWDWCVNHVPQMYLMQAVIAQQIEDFAKFPPRQKPASFNLDSVLEQVKTPHG